VQRIAPNTPFSEKSANYLEESKEFPIFAAENSAYRNVLGIITDS
jgi:hypothetical protein